MVGSVKGVVHFLIWEIITPKREGPATNEIEILKILYKRKYGLYPEVVLVIKYSKKVHKYLILSLIDIALFRPS